MDTEAIFLPFEASHNAALESKDLQPNVVRQNRTQYKDI